MISSDLDGTDVAVQLFRARPAFADNAARNPEIQVSKVHLCHIPAF
jgi:hypothetical protein